MSRYKKVMGISIFFAVIMLGLGCYSKSTIIQNNDNKREVVNERKSIIKQIDGEKTVTAKEETNDWYGEEIPAKLSDGYNISPLPNAESMYVVGSL